MEQLGPVRQQPPAQASARALAARKEGRQASQENFAHLLLCFQAETTPAGSPMVEAGGSAVAHGRLYTTCVSHFYVVSQSTKRVCMGVPRQFGRATWAAEDSAPYSSIPVAAPSPWGSPSPVV